MSREQKRTTRDADWVGDLVEACTERFIAEPSQESTAADLARACDIPLHHVRRLLREHNGSLPGLTPELIHRGNESRDYPGFEIAGAHRVTVYTPSKRHLVGVIRALRWAPGKPLPNPTGC